MFFLPEFVHLIVELRHVGDPLSEDVGLGDVARHGRRVQRVEPILVIRGTCN